MSEERDDPIEILKIRQRTLGKSCACEPEQDWCPACREDDAIETVLARLERAEAEVERLAVGWGKAARERDRLREMLERVRDRLKYMANSEGGLVADIDRALASGEESR